MSIVLKSKKSDKIVTYFGNKRFLKYLKLNQLINNTNILFRKKL